MYILFNTYKASCLNVGSYMEKAFDCLLSSVVMYRKKKKKTVSEYREIFNKTQQCSTENIFLFNSDLYYLFKYRIRPLKWTKICAFWLLTTARKCGIIST